MHLKKIFSAILILYSAHCFGQETIEKKNRLTDNVTEKFFVLKSDENKRDGVYQAYYRKKRTIVRGVYTEGKKTGKWFFYDKNGFPLEVFDYDKNVLRYESREDSSSNFRYLLDKELADSDRVTKPIKIGGRYYGYLPYIGLYKTPLTVNDYDAVYFEGVVELLISPLGRLAEYKVRVFSKYFQYDQTTHMDIHLFNDEDRQFIPATLNGEPILSRIMIRCRMLGGGGLDFF